MIYESNPGGQELPNGNGMALSRLKASWWGSGRDLQAFRLAKFFTLTSFVVILVFTIVLSLILSHRAQKMALAKSEEYLRLLSANLNHQVFQQFLVPTAIEKQGRITIADPDQHERLDSVVKNTIHGFHVEELAIYDQVGVLSYSNGGQPLGTDCFDVPGVKQALFGEQHFERLGSSFLWDLVPHWVSGNQRLRAVTAGRGIERKRCKVRGGSRRRAASSQKKIQRPRASGGKTGEKT